MAGGRGAGGRSRAAARGGGGGGDGGGGYAGERAGRRGGRLVGGELQLAQAAGLSVNGEQAEVQVKWRSRRAGHSGHGVSSSGSSSSSAHAAATATVAACTTSWLCTRGVGAAAGVVGDMW